MGKMDEIDLSCVPEELRWAFESYLKDITGENKKKKKYSSAEIKNNRELALEAVRDNGKLLKHLSKELKNDEEIVMEAVKNHWEALQYAGIKARDNEEIVRTAMKQQAFALCYASKRLRDNRELAVEAVKIDGGVIDGLSARLKKDKELCILAVSDYWKAYRYIDESCKSDRDVILAAAKSDGAVLQLIPRELLDEEICMEAVKSTGFSMWYVPEKLRTKEMYMEAVLYNGQWENACVFWSMPTEYMNVQLYIQALKRQRVHYQEIKDLMERKERWENSNLRPHEPAVTPEEEERLKALEVIHREYKENKEVQLLELFYENVDVNICSMWWYFDPANQNVFLGMPQLALRKNDILTATKRMFHSNPDLVVFLDKRVLLVDEIYESFLEALKESEYAEEPEMKSMLEQGDKEQIVDVYFRLAGNKF